jgi:hypothetical protein
MQLPATHDLQQAGVALAHGRLRRKGRHPTRAKGGIKVKSQDWCGWLLLHSGDGIGLTERESATEQGTARDHT